MNKKIYGKSSDDLKKLYGKEYVEKFSKIGSSLRIERILKHLNLTLNDHVVDFACGNGVLTEYIAHSVSSYVGVDFSDEFIKEALEKQKGLKLENVSFICSEINDFCDKNVQAFDCAFALDFFEHIYDNELLEILISINKSLRKGGRLYIHTPNSLFFIERMKESSIILKQFPEHVAVRSPEEVVKLLKEAGFRIKYLLLLPHYNALKYVHFISYLPLIGKYFKARIFIEAIK